MHNIWLYKNISKRDFRISESLAFKQRNDNTITCQNEKGVTL